MIHLKEKREQYVPDSHVADHLTNAHDVHRRLISITVACLKEKVDSDAREFEEET